MGFRDEPIHELRARCERLHRVNGEMGQRIGTALREAREATARADAAERRERDMRRELDAIRQRLRDAKKDRP